MRVSALTGVLERGQDGHRNIACLKTSSSPRCDRDRLFPTDVWPNDVQEHSVARDLLNVKQRGRVRSCMLLPEPLRCRELQDRLQRLQSTGAALTEITKDCSDWGTWIIWSTSV